MSLAFPLLSCTAFGVSCALGGEQEIYGSSLEGRTADDNGLKADGEKILTFWQAKTEVKKFAGKKLGADTTTTGDDGAVITVDEALTQYEPTLRKRGARVYNAKLPRFHLTDTLLSKPITLLTEDDLEGWRDSILEKGFAPSSVNRVILCLRAALTQADKTRATSGATG